MHILRRRPRSLAGPSVLALLFTVTGCSVLDGPATAAVPSPGAAADRLCRDLREELPERVEGLGRQDPEPSSELTAGWGDPAIILRCGVPKPAALLDPKAESVTADGVAWLIEPQKNGSFRFTTVQRRVYVEVTLPKSRTDGGVNPLLDFAEPVKKTVPEGIPD